MVEILANNACAAVLRTLDMTRFDEVIPGRGEPHVGVDGITHIRYTRPGVPGEFHLEFRVTHTPPFESQNGGSNV